MKSSKNINAFTFVELIIVTVILAILWAIWFSSFVWNLSYSRDSQRKAAFGQIMASMKLYNKNKWSYPIPEDYFSITNWATSNVVVLQWKLWPNVWLSTLDEIPLDPEAGVPYFYSITKNKQDFQIAWTLENDDVPKSILIWSYKSVAKDVLPTIVLASQWSSNVEVTNANNKKLFIFDSQYNNLPYLFDWTNSPFSDWTDFNTLLTDAEDSKTFSQNSSFESCNEIKDAGKSIWDWNYQIRNNSWSLVTINCTWM